jgi:hypothetical protein
MKSRARPVVRAVDWRRRRMPVHSIRVTSCRSPRWSIFGPPGLTLNALDLNDLYIFQAPGNAERTVLILTLRRSPGSTHPTLSIRACATNSASIRTSITRRI